MFDVLSKRPFVFPGSLSLCLHNKEDEGKGGERERGAHAGASKKKRLAAAGAISPVWRLARMKCRTLSTTVAEPLLVMKLTSR